MATKKHKMFIGGEWVDAINGTTFDDMNPYITTEGNYETGTRR